MSVEQNLVEQNLSSSRKFKFFNRPTEAEKVDFNSLNIQKFDGMTFKCSDDLTPRYFLSAHEYDYILIFL
jgi:hypothetical protein